MGMTMAEKILARASGSARVRPGDVVVCEVDMAVQLDRSFAAVEPAKVARPDHVALVMDHSIPAPLVLDAELQRRARDFAHTFNIERFFDVGRHGIAHQVIIESGLALPGELLACGDSHTSASGALNVAARGLGSLEMISVVCTGRTWFRSSPTVKVVLHGELPKGVYGKDVFLLLADKLGSVEGHDVEFHGEAIASLGLDDRATIATMCTDLSANFALFPADDVILEHARTVADRPFEPVEADPDAEYADTVHVDLSELVPYVAKPDFFPHNTLPVSRLDDPVVIDQAFVGSCANGKLEDLRVAAAIVSGRKVASHVRFIVTPASQRVYLRAVQLGYVAALVEAGAVVTNSTCGACFGGSMGVLGKGDVCITSSTRNFKGRMGSPEAKIYVGSSATVAASAITGRIVDPRPYAQNAGVL